MQITTPLRRMLRRLPLLRNRRYGFRSLQYVGGDTFLVAPFHDLRLLARQEDLPIVQDVFCARRYATLFPFRQTATILDVGSHCGYFSVFASVHSGPGSRILGLEPDADNRALACRNLELNGITNVELLPLGAAGSSGAVDFFRMPGATAQHSIVRGTGRLEAGHVRRIEVVAMGDLFHQHNIGKCDFIKVDCEGAEYPFIYEAPADTLRAITTISMEFHDIDQPGFTGSELAAYLAAQGFSIVEFRYAPTRQNRNYGALLATRRW